MSQEPNTLRIGEVSASGAAVAASGAAAVATGADKTTGVGSGLSTMVAVAAGSNSAAYRVATGRVHENGTAEGVVTDILTGGANTRANEMKDALGSCSLMCAASTPWYMVRRPARTCATSPSKALGTR
jgi:hypothetical protein